jgi:hypothetical protein
VSTLISPSVWHEVRRRPGPSRWVVAAATALGVLVVVAACVAVSRGLTTPGLTSSGASSRWQAGDSTVEMRVRLGNPSERTLTVVSAQLVDEDGVPITWAAPVPVEPVEVPAGTLPSPVDASGSVILPLTVRLDCPAALSTSGEASLLLTTTGTWPQHDIVLPWGTDASWCEPDPSDPLAEG